MKTYSLLLILSGFVLFGCATAQNKKDSEISQKTESSSLEKLVSSKKFEFIATTMLPLGQPAKNLVGSDYSITFSPEKIVSEMPYYGVARRSTGVGRDKGMRFEGEPQDFTIAESRNGFTVTTFVKTDTDSFSISMEVTNSGYATLSIDSKNRDAISYRGQVR